MKNLVLLAALGLVGCAPVLDESRQYYFNQELAKLKEYWPGARNRERMVNVFHGPQRAVGCELLPIESRGTWQNGVSDHTAYQQCWGTPYPSGDFASGQRLKNRPEPLN
jgi:hypothetical protein